MDIRKFIIKSCEKTVGNATADTLSRKRQHESDAVEQNEDEGEVVAKQSTLEKNTCELEAETLIDTDASKWTKPYQPSASTLPSQEAKKSKLYFQDGWYEQFPWLHYCVSVEKLFCFYCAKTCQDQTHAWSKNVEPAFVTTGFYNLKKALKKFRCHQQSHSHFLAVSHYQNQTQPVNVKLCKQKQEQQLLNSKCLKAIVSSVQYMGQCGVALLGHTGDCGNFQELLKLRSQDIPELRSWLERHNSYTSSNIQNEILSLMSHHILRSIIKEMHASEPLQYSIIVDGTQDITGKEQETICLRYVDRNLEPVEIFMGFFETKDRTGQGLFQLITDALLRFNLPMSALRGQTFDGAANMSGTYSGCQSLIKKKYPLAPYVHCGAHCVNLVMETTVAAVPQVRDAIQNVHELGTLCKQSGKFKELFSLISGANSVKYHSLRPLCPTRWTVRVSAIRRVLDQYEAVIDALQEFGNERSLSSDSRAKFSGLEIALTEGNTYLCLVLAVSVFEVLENLCSSLQSSNLTVSGMMEAVTLTSERISALRDDELFLTCYNTTLLDVEKLQLAEVKLPRRRLPPKKLDPRPGTEITYPDALSYFRSLYFQLCDTAAVQLQRRFQMESFELIDNLEKALLSGNVSEKISQYPEICISSLNVQLSMFRASYSYKTVDEAADILRKCSSEVRSLFLQVYILLRCLLVVPASTATGERSFSALRRLKTFLRNSMTQQRLNSVAVCSIHAERLKAVDIHSILSDFVQLNDSRMQTFGPQ